MGSRRVQVGIKIDTINLKSLLITIDIQEKFDPFDRLFLVPASKNVALVKVSWGR